MPHGQTSVGAVVLLSRQYNIQQYFKVETKYEQTVYKHKSSSQVSTVFLDKRSIGVWASGFPGPTVSLMLASNT